MAQAALYAQTNERYLLTSIFMNCRYS